MSDYHFDLPVKYDQITQFERMIVRGQYVMLQRGMCFYCAEDLDLDAPKTITDNEIDWSVFPTGFLSNPIHLQHDHETGLTEGAVHAYCNAVMWFYEGR